MGTSSDGLFEEVEVLDEGGVVREGSKAAGPLKYVAAASHRHRPHTFPPLSFHSSSTLKARLATNKLFSFPCKPPVSRNRTRSERVQGGGLPRVPQGRNELAGFGNGKATNDGCGSNYRVVSFLLTGVAANKPWYKPRSWYHLWKRGIAKYERTGQRVDPCERFAFRGVACGDERLRGSCRVRVLSSYRDQRLL
ncbi:hypothetical protein CALVIDRAFT_33701 [Calocera viscosa TUFC12733]|uniref:Uncharacterized protein n=1 Tax=Calocera viscosa (strain TUFC12733) TaxID=1330018 RepID=A0A167FQ55_CALVF|nr:hypothetical protein CALVIDRAFT_33701 [Calocera viscosa TUFC12733]